MFINKKKMDNTNILIAAAVVFAILVFVYMERNSCPDCPLTPIVVPCPQGRNASITTCRKMFGAYFQGLSRDITTLYTQLKYGGMISSNDPMMEALDKSNIIAYNLALLGKNESEKTVDNLVVSLVNSLDQIMNAIPDADTQKILNGNKVLSFDLQNFKNNITYVQNEISLDLWPNVERYRMLSSGSC